MDTRTFAKWFDETDKETGYKAYIIIYYTNNGLIGPEDLENNEDGKIIEPGFFDKDYWSVFRFFCHLREPKISDSGVWAYIFPGQIHNAVRKIEHFKKLCNQCEHEIKFFVHEDYYDRHFSPSATYRKVLARHLIKVNDAQFMEMIQKFDRMQLKYTQLKQIT